MSNITTVLLRPGIVTKTTPLYQYDYGQVLQFTGAELPDVYEVHFSNSSHGEATTMIGGPNGVTIPDMYLTTGADVYVWLYLHTGNADGETEYNTIIPVIRRASISDAPPTPVQQDAITQAIAALNQAVEQTGQDVIDAEAAKNAAETAQGLSENARDAAIAAQTGAAAAESGAILAKSAAQASQTAAETAQGKAENAQSAAELAQGNAENAQEAAEAAQTGAETAQAQSAALAENASMSAAQAAQGAAAAAGSAQSASAASQAAIAAKDSAAGHASDAESAKASAQAAQGLAESARDTAAQSAAQAAASAANAAGSATAAGQSALAAAQSAENIAELGESVAKEPTAQDILGQTQSIRENLEELVDINRSVRYYDELPEEGTEGYTYLTPDGIYHYADGEYTQLSGGGDLNGFSLVKDAQNRVVLTYTNPEDETDTDSATLASNDTAEAIVSVLQAINANLATWAERETI